MADTVESMSNAELRTKLAEYGFPVMPVTASTRKLMAKKLKLLLETKSKPSSNSSSTAADRRSLAKYSSGEESDGERKSERAKNRRATTATAMLPPPITNKVRRSTPKKELPPRKEPEKGSESEEEQSSPMRTLEEVETVTTRRVTKTFQPYSEKEEYETGSDSDVDGSKINNSKTSTSRIDYSSLPSSTLRHSPVRSSYLPSRPSLLSDYRASSSSTTDDLNSIRSRLGLTSSTLDRPSGSSNYTSTYTSSFKPSPVSGSDEIESPYLSSFTRRLSAMKAAESRNVLKESDVTNGNSASYTGRFYSNRANRHDTTDFKAVGDRNILKNNVVSFTLVGIFCLFFLVIFFAYYGMKSDIAFILEDKANIIPFCQANVAGDDEGVNCVLKSQSADSMELLRLLYPELKLRAIASKCTSDGGSPYMDNENVVQFVNSKYQLAREKILMDLYNLQVLIVNNPKWGLAVIEKQSVYKKDYKTDALRSMQEVLQNRMKHNTALLLLNPPLPMSCIFLNKLHSILTYAVTFASVCGLVFALFMLRKYYLSWRKHKDDNIYSMVEQIIKILSQHAGTDTGDPYMPVTHVRDILIPAQNRDKMAGVWEEAIRFIERNESRVRFEVQAIDGEEFRVFRLICPSGSPPRRSGSGGGASWQGQAFETQEGSVNSLSISPTPCLKIRHMFDKNDANPNTRNIIQDVVLEKCMGKPNILHIDIDKNTGCVYVKCVSPQDAGVVYKNLHGWWYEGNLITVKYLKLDRYMERFPLSPTMGPYLKPSGRKFNL